MSGAKALMDEIRRNHYTADKTVQKQGIPAANTEAAEKQLQPVKRRRRRTTSPAADTGIVPNANMYTISIIGGMAISGYPLGEGEKLVVAKITPVKVAT